MHRYIYVLTALLFSAGEASAHDAWPRAAQGECPEALAYAQKMYNSGAEEMNGASLPASSGMSVALHRIRTDISGGAQLIADGKKFDVDVKGPDSLERARVVYWQKYPDKARRLVVLQGNWSWKGDLYQLLSLPAAMSKDEFDAKLKESSWESLSEKMGPEVKLLVEDSWTPPIILGSESHGTIAIDPGLPTVALGIWKVFDVTGKPACTIRFRFSSEDRASPAPARSPQAGILLPKGPLRQFAYAVDGTLGNGEDEGTSKPTARQRIAMEKMWTNVALRPWAVHDTPRNTRVAVESNLLKWGEGAPSFARQRRLIDQLYPRAEKALIAYYIQRFHRSHAQAKSAAFYILDVAFRAAFVFPASDRDHVRAPSPNPWVSPVSSSVR